MLGCQEFFDGFLRLCGHGRHLLAALGFRQITEGTVTEHSEKLGGAFGEQRLQLLHLRGLQPEPVGQLLALIGAPVRLCVLGFVEEGFDVGQSRLAQVHQGFHEIDAPTLMQAIVRTVKRGQLAQNGLGVALDLDARHGLLRLDRLEFAQLILEPADLAVLGDEFLVLILLGSSDINRGRHGLLGLLVLLHGGNDDGGCGRPNRHAGQNSNNKVCAHNNDNDDDYSKPDCRRGALSNVTRLPGAACRLRGRSRLHRWALRSRD
ncbi:MAG: hypothetical protein EXS22_09445 [Pedosphaera sp.]|nr:hypothetical protein [Pedosphaera sp.]MSU44239.1 hypothetical protein [Pedosphaera sp.]